MSAQNDTIKYSALNSATVEKGNYMHYVAKSGKIYSVGDTLYLGTPTTPTFLYVRQWIQLNGVQPLPNNYAGSRCVIKKIMVTGNKRAGYTVQLQTTGGSVMDNYFINLEAALKIGEVQQ